MKNLYVINEKLVIGQPSFQFPDEQKKDTDQHYIDLINGKITPANDHERQFLKEVSEAKDKGLTVEIPID